MGITLCSSPRFFSQEDCAAIAKIRILLCGHLLRVKRQPSAMTFATFREDAGDALDLDAKVRGESLQHGGISEQRVAFLDTAIQQLLRELTTAKSNIVNVDLHHLRRVVLWNEMVRARERGDNICARQLATTNLELGIDEDDQFESRLQLALASCVIDGIDDAALSNIAASGSAVSVAKQNELENAEMLAERAVKFYSTQVNVQGAIDKHASSLDLLSALYCKLQVQLRLSRLVTLKSLACRPTITSPGGDISRTVSLALKTPNMGIGHKAEGAGLELHESSYYHACAKTLHAMQAITITGCSDENGDQQRCPRRVLSSNDLAHIAFEARALGVLPVATAALEHLSKHRNYDPLDSSGCNSSAATNGGSAFWTRHLLQTRMDQLDFSTATHPDGGRMDAALSNKGFVNAALADLEHLVEKIVVQEDRKAVTYAGSQCPPSDGQRDEIQSALWLHEVADSLANAAMRRGGCAGTTGTCAGAHTPSLRLASAFFRCSGLLAQYVALGADDPHAACNLKLRARNALVASAACAMDVALGEIAYHQLGSTSLTLRGSATLVESVAALGRQALVVLNANTALSASATTLSTTTTAPSSVDINETVDSGSHVYCRLGAVLRVLATSLAACPSILSKPSTQTDDAEVRGIKTVIENVLLPLLEQAYPSEDKRKESQAESASPNSLTGSDPIEIDNNIEGILTPDLLLQVGVVVVMVMGGHRVSPGGRGMEGYVEGPEKIFEAALRAARQRRRRSGGLKNPALDIEAQILHHLILGAPTTDTRLAWLQEVVSSQHDAASSSTKMSIVRNSCWVYPREEAEHALSLAWNMGVTLLKQRGVGCGGSIPKFDGGNTEEERVAQAQAERLLRVAIEISENLCKAMEASEAQENDIDVSQGKSISNRRSEVGQAGLQMSISTDVLSRVRKQHDVMVRGYQSFVANK